MKLDEFDAKYPGWREVISGKPPAYDETAHQAFKHQHRKIVAEMKAMTTGCWVCRAERMVVADASPDWQLRGLVCRPCRHVLTSVPVEYHQGLPEFWLDYCPTWCKKAGRFVCQHHRAMSEYWTVAAAYTSKAPIPLE